MTGPWHIWIDTGGTFTDCLARDPQGTTHRAKVLSRSAFRGRVEQRLDARRWVIRQNWPATLGLVEGGAAALLEDAGRPRRVERFDPATSILEMESDDDDAEIAGRAFEVRFDEPAPVVAARIVTGTSRGRDLPPAHVRLATTHGTNALLERQGAATALFITAGFADLLRIGNQQRPDLFALRIVRPEPLPAAIVEVAGRLAADGSELTPIDLEPVASAAARLHEQGIRAAAIALMHSYRNPAHESAVAEVVRNAGFEYVSCSSDLAPLIRLLPRCETAVVDAYLGPVLGAYIDRVRECMPTSRIHVMTSAGGLVRADQYRARDSLLSGPAGGVAGAAAAGRASGFDQVIGFDMGGTSTDVARYDGDFEYRFEHTVGDAHLVAPALAIETVAAGGGSMCTLAGDRLRVGPRSAGSWPGPACYGAGGPLTLTDVNLLLGRLDPQAFEIPIDVAPAQAALDWIVREVAGSAGAEPDHDALLDGFLDIANERMADAIARISVREGYDPRAAALVAFGGAGGQHACAVASRLGIETIVMPADASLLSALGLGRAVPERFAQRQVLERLDDVEDRIRGWLDELADEATAQVQAEGVDRASIRTRRRLVHLRLLGQDASIPIDVEPGTAIREAFADRYRAIYAHAPEGRPIEVESIRAVASAIEEAPPRPAPESIRPSDAPPGRTARARFEGAWIDVPAWSRDDLVHGARLSGPALVFARRTSFVIEPGWSAEIDGAGAIVLRRCGNEERRKATARPRVVERELFTHRFMSIAREMGQMLERTALSTNVKERLDFSCTVLDASGELVVNAPHMPVHLGAMGLCVRALRDAIEMRDGDVVVTNHPACGGSHLPDITVVTPAYEADRLIGYVASRAHHAEIGGTRPGSMPPDATSLAEEGVVIGPMRLIDAGRPRFGEVERLLRARPHPSRAVAENLADLRAQVAANHRGAAALREMVRRHGTDVVASQMAGITAQAEQAARRALAARPDGRAEAEEHLDDGSPIRVSIEVRGGTAIIDFAGTAAQHPRSLNATPAIVRSAVIYVLRLLIGESLPLNEGIMRAVDVRIPRGLLNPEFPADPAACPAVVGGNVETSQRVVDTLLKALGLCACSQGTMNNTLFGTESFGYYETVCGGSGAGPGFDGADAVHTHMTNTRITDPEVLEQRYPVRVERFAIRRGSGGAGQFRGGDGAIREITFLAPMSLSVLGQHRREGPYGMEGGEPGAAARQTLVRASGEVIELDSIDGAEVCPGDRMILETPGGGGWGRESSVLW